MSLSADDMRQGGLTSWSSKTPLFYWRRRAVSLLGWILCGVCFFALGFALLDILFVVCRNGISAMKPELFTTPTNGVSGGLLNAIEGTAVLTLGSVLIAAPIGIGIGAYLSESSSGRSVSVGAASAIDESVTAQTVSIRRMTTPPGTKMARGECNFQHGEMGPS